MYITFEEYQSFGGTVELSAFPLLERLAEKKLDYWTFNRITEDTEITEDIKLAMVVIINMLDAINPNENIVTSYSLDGQSESFLADDRKTQEAAAYKTVVEILPPNLCYLGV